METFSLHIRKKNPKPNAPKYEIETLGQLFDILTEENHKRFLKSFATQVKLILAMKNLMSSVGESLHPEIKNDISLKTMTWIDD